MTGRFLLDFDALDPKYSGNASTPPSGVPGQDSPDALPATSTGRQPATDLEATHPGPDSPADRPLPSDTAEGSTGSVATDQLGIETFTEGQVTATPSSREPVLPSAEAGVSEAGGVEDGPVSPGPGLSSADPASDWMTSWRGLIRTALAVSEYLTEDELAEVSDDMATLAKVLFEDTP